MVSSILVGFFTKRVQVAKANLLMLSAVGFITYLIMSIPIVFNYYQILLVMLFGGISAAWVVIAFSLIPHYVKSDRAATAIALNNTFVVLGGYSGQILFGVILQNFNINEYIPLIIDPSLEPFHYSALLIYLVFTFFGLFCALFIYNEKLS